eukprot:6083719-Prymnesium_polylepis.1
MSETDRGLNCGARSIAASSSDTKRGSRSILSRPGRSRFVCTARRWIAVATLTELSSACLELTYSSSALNSFCCMIWWLIAPHLDAWIAAGSPPLRERQRTVGHRAHMCSRARDIHPETDSPNDTRHTQELLSRCGLARACWILPKGSQRTYARRPLTSRATHHQERPALRLCRPSAQRVVLHADKVSAV